MRFRGLRQPHPLPLGTHRTNRSEYDLRRRNIASPLADARGPTGRTRAIAAAIRTGLDRNDNLDMIEHKIHDAEHAGLPFTLWRYRTDRILEARRHIVPGIGDALLWPHAEEILRTLLGHTDPAKVANHA